MFNLADKDNFSMSVGAKGIGSFGFKTADNWLTCDSAGNCMLKDELKAADNSLVCDSIGNCMLKDELAAADKDNFGMNFGVKGMNFGFKTEDLKDELLYGATSATWTPKMADNSLTCDSQGNCMLKDSLALTCDSQGNCVIGEW